MEEPVSADPTAAGPAAPADALGPGAAVGALNDATGADEPMISLRRSEEHTSELQSR